MTIQTTEINETNMAQILGDGYSKTILMATHMRPHTALEISEDHGIPVAACYRRIKSLHEIGLIRKEERYLTQKGKRIWKYLSNVHQIELFYSNGKVMAKGELRNGYVKDIR